MNIKMFSEPDGSYLIEGNNMGIVPEGFLEIPPELLPVWNQYAPFVTLVLEAGEIVAMFDNPEARQAAEAAQSSAPDPSAPDLADVYAMLVDLEYQVTLVQMGVS